MSEHLCYLHEDDDPEHWVTEADTVGIILMADGQLVPEAGLVPASRVCAAYNGIGPERIVDWEPALSRGSQ